MKQLQRELLAAIAHAPGSHGTREQRRQCVRQLLEFLEAANLRHNRAAELRPGTVMRWVEHMRAAGLSARTIANRLATLRRLAPRALAGFDNRRLGVPPASRAGSKRAITPEEFAACFARLTDAGVRAAVLLQAALGLRALEALKSYRWLQAWERAVLEGRPVAIAEGSAGGAKGGRDRWVQPADRERTLQAIRYAREVAARQPGGFLVVGRRRDAKGALKSAYDNLANATRRAGFAGPISQHSMRYAFAQARLSVLRAQGYSERQAEVLVVRDLGHGPGRHELLRSVYGRTAAQAPPDAPAVAGEGAP